MAQKLTKIFFLLFILCEFVFPQSKQSLFLPLRQSERLVLQPNGKFAVLFFNEDALAIYCAVIYYEAMTNPKDCAWKISERIWQDPIWSSDVTGIAWSPNGKYLYIATCEIYGDGGLFQLNLMEKTYNRILPEIGDTSLNESFETNIDRIDENTGTLIVTVTSVDDKSGYHKTSKIKMDSAHSPGAPR